MSVFGGGCGWFVLVCFGLERRDVVVGGREWMRLSLVAWLLLLKKVLVTGIVVVYHLGIIVRSFERERERVERCHVNASVLQHLDKRVFHLVISQIIGTKIQEQTIQAKTTDIIVCRCAHAHAKIHSDKLRFAIEPDHSVGISILQIALSLLGCRSNQPLFSMDLL